MNLLQKFHHSTYSFKMPTYGARLRPYRDWFVILGLLGILLIAGTGLGAYTFVSVQRGEVIGTAVPLSPKTFNNVSIQAVKNLFAERGAVANKYKNGAYTFIDPSR